MVHRYKYPRPCVTVDAVIFGVQSGRLLALSPSVGVLVVRRGGTPFKGRWALPGGVVEENEDLEPAVRREVFEETNLHTSEIELEQLGAFGTPGRDPRGHTISVAYMGVCQAREVNAGSDAIRAIWMADPLALAFDHAQILAAARDRLAERAKRYPVGFEFLGAKFTLRELQSLHQAMTGAETDVPNFRKQVLRNEFLVECGTLEPGVGRAGPPTRLYKLNPRTYRQLQLTGYTHKV